MGTPTESTPIAGAQSDSTSHILDGESHSCDTTLGHDTEDIAPMPASDLNAGNRLLSLPGELRNRIYAMTVEDAIANAKNDHIRLQIALSYPRLIDTCRQIREECKSLFEPKTLLIFKQLYPLHETFDISRSLKQRLLSCKHRFAYQHKTIEEGCSKWLDYVQSSYYYEFGGVIEFDVELNVDTIVFFADYDDSPL